MDFYQLTPWPNNRPKSAQRWSNEIRPRNDAKGPKISTSALSFSPDHGDFQNTRTTRSSTMAETFKGASSATSLNPVFKFLKSTFLNHPYLLTVGMDHDIGENLAFIVHGKHAVGWRKQKQKIPQCRKIQKLSDYKVWKRLLKTSMILNV
ncbi:hypothetical protein Droror1_Dr00014928 [Drosera rotundifolia]